MPAFLCASCGTQYPNSEEPPPFCVLCRDDRRAVNPPRRQSWTTQAALRQTHFTVYRRLSPGLMGIGTMPAFALGQRALLVRTPNGNVLWDCVSFVDDATTTIVTALGGVAAIAVSHPLFYGAMVEWSHAFGSPPVYLHAADRKFVTRQDPVVTFWDDEAVEVVPGVTLLRCGGHFLGATMLHWAQGAGGLGAMLSGGSVQITPDGYVSFMRSYPNLIPLDSLSVQHIHDVLDPWPFDAIHGGWWDQIIQTDARRILASSVKRYQSAVTIPPPL